MKVKTALICAVVRLDSFTAYFLIIATTFGTVPPSALYAVTTAFDALMIFSVLDAGLGRQLLPIRVDRRGALRDVYNLESVKRGLHHDR